MERSTLHVCWTMDCEAVQAESPATGGPADWTLSERAMRGYVEALSQRGQRVTLFLTPRLAEQQAGVVADLVAAGAEAGMHLHPQTTDINIPYHLGHLPREVQRELLRTSRDRVAQACGRAPTSFRPGCFSASDDTYELLAELGFTAGSVSLPGRTLADRGAVWNGADPFAHWAAAENRLAAGRLPFLEVPTAVALEEVQGPATPPRDVRHLRLECEGISTWAPALIRTYLARQDELRVPLKTLVVMTHNTRCYDDPDDGFRRNLEAVAAAVTSAVEAQGWVLRAVTLAALRGLAGAAPA